MYGFEEYDFDISEYSIEDVREDLNAVVKFFQAKDYHEHAMQLFMVDYRNLPMEVVKIAVAYQLIQIFKSNLILNEQGYMIWSQLFGI